MTTVRISLREELIFLLTEATELEHSLCCSYLFMAFSLKSTVPEGLTDETVGAVRRWKRVLSDIAIEEMMHLAIINDILVAIGGAPNLDRPNFPHGCSYYMPDLQVELRPFSEEALRHFIAVEQPAGGTLPLVINPDLVQRVEGDLDNEIGADPYNMASQGDVYDMVLTGLKELVGRLGETNVFIGPPPSEALQRFFQSYGWEPVRDLETAISALEKVVEQGEGGSADSANSHHWRFSGILDEYLDLREKDHTFEPSLPVLSNPFARTPPEANGPVNLLEDEFAIQISDLFNEVYAGMLQLLARFFVTTTESEQQASTLCDASIETMAGAVVPLGEMLVRLPAGANRPGFNAGPSFVVRTLHPLPHRDAAWKLLHERFGELRDYTARLAIEKSGSQPLLQVGEALSRVVGMLS